MAQQSQHPIDASDWHKAYPIPSPPPVPSVTPDELAAMMLSQKEEHGPGKSFLVVDVRRADCKSMIPTAVNFPSHSLPHSLPTLLNLLSAPSSSAARHPLLLVFHCNSCKGRGPRSAAWVRDALRAREGEDGRQIEVAILEGGCEAWEKRFGARRVEERGFEHWGMRRLTEEEDLKMIQL